eukprot:TRINITY_DN24099_c0_g1_i2.p1 TRINITY_DN24099_c0_g1~~TRINITY_DN24099_c0_g1_i2.p1  ORF type:complete len:125 (-),score=39.42 TRINITY_DN24099_c0_g1_i2:198-572(-)
MTRFSVIFFFFFQAEDGIRDAQESRGLGDVYKRQKLYRVFTEDLQAGEYEMDIVEFFDVSSFGGEKAFALATVTWAGGKNEFLAIAYIVVGAIVLVAGIVFIIVHKACGDRSQKAIEELMNEMK